MSIQYNTRLTMAVCIALSSLALTACDRTDEAKTTGEKVDQAIGTVDDTVSDAKVDIKEKMEDVKKTTTDAAGNAAAALTDSAITTGVKAKLAGDDELKSLDISISTNAGHVTMQGTAPNASARTRARQLASEVQGVMDVDNQLHIEKN